MKFFKTKAGAALSIALLLSTQAKGMGADFGIDAEDMALTKTEQIKQVAQAAGQEVGQAIKSTYQAATPHMVNALGITVDAGKSAFNGAVAHPYMTGGLLGAAAFTYAKPNLAGKVATVAIPAGMVAAIAHDNPELVQAGKEAVVNASKAVAHFATTNAPVVYNAVTNNVVADVIKNNPEYIIPGLIAGSFATYYGYAPAKRGVAKVAGKVAQAAKRVAPYAVKTAAVVAPVAAVAAVAKYSPETLVVAKDAAIKAGQTVINAGAGMVKAVHEFDYKKMAENAGKWLAQKGQVVSTHMPAVNANSTAAIASASAAGAAATGYGVYETVKMMNANANQVDRLPETTNELINVDSIIVPVTEGGSQNQEPVIVQSYVPDIHAPAKKKVVLVPVAKPAPARPKVSSKQELPVIVEEQNPLLQVVLPGQDKAPVLNVYQTSARNEVSSSVKEAVSQIVDPIINRPVAQNVENIATMLSALETSQLKASDDAQGAKAYADLLEKANQLKEYFELDSRELSILNTDIKNLKQGKGNLDRISKRIEFFLRSSKSKNAAFKAS